MGKYSHVLVAMCFAALTFGPCEANSDKCLGGSVQGDWYTFRGRYYYVNKKFNGGYTYSEALDECATFGATLAASYNSDVQYFMEGIFLSKGFLNVWVGIRNTATSDNGDLQVRRQGWVWETGDRYNVNEFHKWSSPEPSQHETCMRMTKPGTTFKWAGMFCEDKKYNFICERPTSPCTSVCNRFPCNGGCPGDDDNWHSFRDRYYYVSPQSTPVTYEAAKAKCAELDSTLASASSRRMNAFIKGILTYKNIDQAWIGLKYTLQSNNNDDVSVRRRNWAWENEDPYDVNAWQLPWGVQEPSPGEVCMRMTRPTSGYDQTYRWAGISCNVNYHYVCERPISPCALCHTTCEAPGGCWGDDENWHTFSGRYFYVRSGYTKFHSSAENECEGFGGTLAASNDIEVNSYLMGLLATKNINSAWIGLQYTQQSNTDPNVNVRRQAWAWDTGNQYGFQNWTTNQPEVDDNTVILIRSSNNPYYGWQGKRSSANIKHSYICERQDSPCPPVMDCNEMWNEFNGKYYYLRTDIPAQRFLMAREKCAELGGKLAKITNKETNDFLVGLLRRDDHYRAWIGLNWKNEFSDGIRNDNADADYRRYDWKWDGDSSGYYFNNKYHNLSASSAPGPNHECMLLYNGNPRVTNNDWPSWDGLDCRFRSNYICERATSPCDPAGNSPQAQSSSASPSAPSTLTPLLTTLLTTLLPYALRHLTTPTP